VVGHLLRHPRRYRHVHFADAALAPLAVLARRVTGVPVTVTAHALDVVYPHPLYQALVARALARVDGVVAVSRFTRDACVERGVSPTRCRVIPNGIHCSSLADAAGAPGTGGDLPAGLAGRRVLVSIGRLIRRKGTAWFVAEVLPRLDSTTVYLVGGEGPERPAIERAAAAAGVTGRVVLLGRVDEVRKRALLARADLAVMPNIAVPGDAEGFGIAVIEATARGVPVIASDLEGVRDAVLDGVTGRLVAERDAAAWVRAIDAARFDRDAVARATREHFDWVRLADAYLEFFAQLAAPEAAR
jgi:glycosyltransferase involved in cell wall biosynthesis